MFYIINVQSTNVYYLHHYKNTPNKVRQYFFYFFFNVFIREVDDVFWDLSKQSLRNSAVTDKKWKTLESTSTV